MNSKYFIFGIIVFVIIVVILGISLSGTEDTIKIGFVAPLTGDVAIWGNSALAGVQLAVDEINETGGINGQKVELFFQDGQCSAEAAAKAYNSLVNGYELAGILGPVCSPEASSGLPITAKDNMPDVIITASAPDLTALGNNIFRVYPSDTLQGSFAAEYAYNNLGVRKVAIIYATNSWSQGLNDKFTQTFERLGGKVIYSDFVKTDQIDVKDIILNAEGSSPDLFYFPVYPQHVMQLLKELESQENSNLIMLGDATATPEVIESGLGSGAYFVLPASILPKSFEKKIIDKSGITDLKINVAAPFGYDAAKVLLSAMENANSLSHEDVIKELKKTSMEGISNPLIEFDEQGDLKNAAFQVMKIENKESILVE